MKTSIRYQNTFSTQIWKISTSRTVYLHTAHPGFRSCFLPTFSESACLRSFFFFSFRPPPRSTLFPYTTLFRSLRQPVGLLGVHRQIVVGQTWIVDFRRNRRSHVLPAFESMEGGIGLQADASDFRV